MFELKMVNNATYKKQPSHLDAFGCNKREKNEKFTFVPSESLIMYASLFSLRGRLELFVFPVLPTRCIAETKTGHNSQGVNILKELTAKSSKKRHTGTIDCITLFIPHSNTIISNIRKQPNFCLHQYKKKVKITLIESIANNIMVTFCLTFQEPKKRFTLIGSTLTT